MRNLCFVSLLLVLALDCSSALAIQYNNDTGSSIRLQDTVIVDYGDSIWKSDTGRLYSQSPDGDVFSEDDDFPGLACSRCRDPDSYPVDFAAFAYNAYFGDNPWGWELELGIPFRVYNLSGEWTAVWFEDVLMDRYSFLPDTMTVVVRLQTGAVLRVEMLEEGPDMPIGDNDTNTTGGGAGGGDDDDYDDMNDDESGDIEIDEPTGDVEIEDPDEDGKFFDWEEEE